MDTEQQDPQVEDVVVGPVMRYVGFGVAVLLLAGLGYYFFVPGQTPQQKAEADAKSIVAAVGKLIVLPADEEPIIATVADPKQLAGQPFFQNAQIGDKVLIYNIAKKAILYRSDAHLIVDVAPLSSGKPTPTPKK